MMRCVQTLSLVFLSALASAAPPSTPGRCSSCRYGADIVGTVVIPDASKAWLDMAQGANLHTGETAVEQQSIGRKGSTPTKHLFEDGNTTVEGERNAVRRLVVAPLAAGAKQRTENAKLKACSAALQWRETEKAASSVTVNEWMSSRLLRRRPSNVVLLARKRISRAVTNEERTALSEKLHASALEGRIEDMRQLIGRGADVYFRNANGYTAVHLAAASDQLEAMRLLIDRGANVNTANTYGTTPLHIASSKNSVKCVVALVGARAIVGPWDQWGQTPLHVAASYGHETVVQVLLGAGEDPSVRDKEGKTAKDLAESVAVQALFSTLTRTTAPSLATTTPTRSSDAASTPASTPTQTGAVPQLPPSRGLTEEEWRTLSEKLLETAEQGRVEDMKQLIGQGADVAYKNKEGVTALHLSAKNIHMGALRVLLDSGAPVDAMTNIGHTPLQWAAGIGRMQFVEALAAAGADLNPRDIDGDTPLHDAAYENKVGMARTLLTLGANSSIWNNDGKTPNDLAKSDAMRVLLPAAADATTTTTTTIHTPTDQEGKALSEELLAAARDGRIDEMRQLIAKGADVRYKNRHGETALHRAAQNGHLGALRVLIDSGAPVDAMANTGTPLHWAAWNGRTQFVEELAVAGANINARDIDGDTPLHDAAYFDKVGSVRTLLTLGANSSIWNNNGKTPNDLAKSDAVRTLLAAAADATTTTTTTTTIHTSTDQEGKALSEKLLAAARDGRV